MAAGWQDNYGGFMKNAICILMAALMLSAASCTSGVKQNQPKACDIKEVGGRVVQNLLDRPYMLYGDKKKENEKGLHYAEACAAVGALRFAKETGNQDMLDKVIARYEGFLKEKEDGKLFSRVSHVDHNVEGIVPLQIYLTNGDKRYLEVGLSFADSQWAKTTPEGLTDQTRFWIDDMYMVGMLQIQAYRATKDVKYADRAALQLVLYVRKLQQPNGLFFHGPKFPFHWGRGNGWVAASMAEVLSSVPANNPNRAELMASYKKMMVMLLKCQSDNGMWRQLVDYPYAWQESSCTAMFAYAMSVGVDQGWLNKKEYGPAVQKATHALCAHVDRKGNVRDVCEGTGQTNDIEFYLNRKRILGDFHGQAPVLWLISENIK
jgi:unsaturated rhamnogalacturonyl hydrolase